MGKLSYTAKLTLSIKMEEVLEYCDPICLRKDLAHWIKQELMQCAEGIINGETGGMYCDGWRHIFFIKLAEEGHVELKPNFYEDFDVPREYFEQIAAQARAK